MLGVSVSHMAKSTEWSYETRLSTLSLGDISPTASLEAVEEAEAKHPPLTAHINSSLS